MACGVEVRRTGHLRAAPSPNWPMGAHQYQPAHPSYVLHLQSCRTQPVDSACTCIARSELLRRPQCGSHPSCSAALCRQLAPPYFRTLGPKPPPPLPRCKGSFKELSTARPYLLRYIRCKCMPASRYPSYPVGYLQMFSPILSPTILLPHPAKQSAAAGPGSDL